MGYFGGYNPRRSFPLLSLSPSVQLMAAFSDGRDEEVLICQTVVVGLHKMGVWAGQGGVCSVTEACLWAGFSLAGHLLCVTVVKLQAPVLSEVGAVSGAEGEKRLLNDPGPMCCSSARCTVLCLGQAIN